MTDWLLAAVVALLPLSALITVLQRRPYYALISRGIMGGIAALVYAVFGASDVALTEVLMGTFLMILLYAIAVRSSMLVRVGWIRDRERSAVSGGPSCDIAFHPIQHCCRQHELETEFIGYDTADDLLQALRRGRIGAAYAPAVFFAADEELPLFTSEEFPSGYALATAGPDEPVAELFSRFFSVTQRNIPATGENP